MTTRYLIRFDDVVPCMAWSRFAAFERLADSLAIPYLIGVVPECRDPTLMFEPAREDFWTWVRSKKASGWTIAQHGYRHLYETEARGILGLGRKSEFAGLSYDAQYQKLAFGKALLQAEAVWSGVFMAPSHSFDALTLEALRALDFTALTDGFGFYPYALSGLKAVPQLFARPLGIGFGIETICLHVNTMNDHAIETMIEFIRTHHQQIMSFDDALAIQPPVPLLSPLLRQATSIAVRLRQMVRK